MKNNVIPIGWRMWNYIKISFQTLQAVAYCSSLKYIKKGILKMKYKQPEILEYSTSPILPLLNLWLYLHQQKASKNFPTSKNVNLS